MLLKACLLCVLLGIASCYVLEHPTVPNQNLPYTAKNDPYHASTHLRNLVKWIEYRDLIGGTYWFKLHICEIPVDAGGPFLIQVEDEVVITALYEDSALGPVPPSVLEALPTITTMFYEIADTAQDADLVHVIYEPDTGMPSKTYIDHMEAEEEDEFTILAELT